MKLKELQELFCAKIAIEYKEFKEHELQLSSEEIFAHAYQIDCMINIYEFVLEMSQNLSEEVLKNLILKPDLLVYLYEAWMKKADSFGRELAECLLEGIENLIINTKEVKV